jgi:exo-1,4-beta-D-glucosaminidase
MSETVDVSLAPGTSARVRSLADLKPPTPVWFLDLRLADRTGTELARNFYWLSTTEDVLDYENNLWFVTPAKGFADFTALAELPEVELELSSTIERRTPELEVAVRMINPTEALAFFVELRLVNPRDESYLPVLWDDNYVSLLPGEERLVRARLPQTDDVAGAAVIASGWNVPVTAVALDVEPVGRGRAGAD